MIEDVAVIAYRWWLIAYHRPFIKCPFCKGKGGAMSGYYEPEWSECVACHHHWDDLVDFEMSWFEGRMPVWEYVRSRLSIWCGLWFPAKVRQLIACKLGLHTWMNEDKLQPGLRICCVCYKDKTVKQ